MKTLGHIAYNKLEGKSPTVVFFSGFRSDMEGSKAVYLESVCRELGLAYIRFDYSGHGKSGVPFKDCSIGTWLADSLKVIDELTKGDLILVGSSMGGWISLLAALERKDRVKGLIGIAAAPDFTEELIWDEFTEAQHEEMNQNGVVVIPNCYDDCEPYPITRQLIEEGRKHLLLGGTIDIACPVRLLHGMQDEDVPYNFSERIAKKLTSNDVLITYVKNGTHRMSEPQNLELLKTTLIDITKLI